MTKRNTKQVGGRDSSQSSPTWIDIKAIKERKERGEKIPSSPVGGGGMGEEDNAETFQSR